uniref:Alpha-mannosidase n=1 Tax=Nothobranchius kadleci TaxID=1051664 RepID=A0A1A8C1Y5_NOTKA
MKRGRVLAVLVGGLFCFAVMSLYRMLELMQRAEPEQHRGTPYGQVDEDLSQLQQKIDRLEHLLVDNNHLVAQLRDSLLHKRSNSSLDSSHRRVELLPGCRIAEDMKGSADGVQLLDVYDLLPFDNPDGGVWKQGFEISYRGDEWAEHPLELFLVPHSHNDPGWLKTFDGYYQDQTRHILDNMLVKLGEDSRRKMIWAEISYFSKWWNSIDEQKRVLVKRLVEAGQLELNIKERALLLLDQYRQKSRLFRSSVLLVPLGDDFRFVESREWDAQFDNYQKLFDYFNQHPELHVRAHFGTLSDYFTALQRRLSTTGTTLPTLQGDFFTYADRDDHYWSGYFTSRPFYKRLDRTLESTLRATEIVFSLTMAEMRRFRGDISLLFHSILNLHQVLQSSAHWLLLSDKSQYNPDQSKTLLQMDETISAQDTLPQKMTLALSDVPRSVVVFNPTEQFRTSVVSIVVDSPDARVVDAKTSQPMATQISAVWVEPSQASAEVFQLSFIAELPPLALLVYHVTKAPTGSTPRAHYILHRHGNLPTVHSEYFQVSPLQGTEANTPLLLSNKHLQIWSSPETGLMQKLRLQSGLVRQVQVKFLWYGTRTSAHKDKSGAYLFLPGEEGPQPYLSSDPPLIRVTRGPIFSDITSCFKHFTHTVRVFHLDGHAGKSLEISNTVDIRSEVNRELVMRLVSDVASSNRFYSDLNGFQMQQRRTLEKLPLQANFYPMSSSSFLQDSTSRLSLLSAQSQAVASLRSGELEVVLDRRLQQDDNRGLGQGVTDNKLTASLYHLLLEDRVGGAQEVGGASVDHLSLLAHLASLSLCHPPITMAAPTNTEVPKLHPFLPLHSSLPCDIHLLNLRTLEDPQESGSPSQEVGLLLHRKGFDCSTSPSPALSCTWTSQEEVNLDDLFSPLRFRSVRRTGLTLLRDHDESDSAHKQVLLHPMEISAFRVHLD